MGIRLRGEVHVRLQLLRAMRKEDMDEVTEEKKAIVDQMAAAGKDNREIAKAVGEGIMAVSGYLGAKKRYEKDKQPADIKQRAEERKEDELERLAMELMRDMARILDRITERRGRR